MLSLKTHKDTSKGWKDVEVVEINNSNGRYHVIKKLLLLILSIFLYNCLVSSCCLPRLFELAGVSHRYKQAVFIDFYHNITRPRFSCVLKDGKPTSFAGTIGLRGDSEETPKCSFFWYFEAENDPQDAPIILSIGGGPGISGLLNGVNGQSRCSVTASSTLEYNPDGWTEHFNLLLLDHMGFIVTISLFHHLPIISWPTNVGYSYGTRVNNSRDAAVDAYDCLQKFFRLFPQLRKNKFVLSGGSYGGIYIPNIAYVIHENNKAVLNGTANPGSNLLINLESVMMSNPISEPLIYHEWLLQYRCNMHQVYNSTACSTMFSNLPSCLEAIQLAYQYSNVQYRALAEEICYKYTNNAATDVVLEDVRRRCRAMPKDPAHCHPLIKWSNTFFKNESTKNALGLAGDRTFFVLNGQVETDFATYGDLMQPHQELLIPVMKDGIRVLYYIGAQDANCPWPGTLSSLKQLRGPYQISFLSTPDILWDSGLGQKVTIRQVGKGAGDFTYILIDQAGHFVVHDQPKLAKMIAGHWICGIPFANVSMN